MEMKEITLLESRNVFIHTSRRAILFIAQETRLHST